MLEQEQMVALVEDERPLERERVVVGDPAEPADAQRPLVDRRGIAGDGQRTSASQSRVSMISFTRCMNAAA